MNGLPKLLNLMLLNKEVKMPTIEHAYENALLADAAYASGLVVGLKDDALAGILDARMTETQAKYIGDNFMVVASIESPVSSFDATVWRRNSDGKIFVSMRGTQQLTDFLVDADLAVTGNARAQVTDMINWWL